MRSQSSDAFEDGRAREALVDDLVERRKESGLTQTEVARRMGVRQPTVSQIENEGSDPRLSTVQRYARAIGVIVRFEVPGGDRPPRADPPGLNQGNLTDS